MGIREDIGRVKKNITKEFEIRKAKIFALSLSYAGRAINEFRAAQDGDAFWENQTHTAANRMFSNAFQEGDLVGWFLSHGVFYGVYLELANDRQNEAIRPIINRLAPEFFKDVRKLY